MTQGVFAIHYYTHIGYNFSIQKIVYAYIAQYNIRLMLKRVKLL